MNSEFINLTQIIFSMVMSGALGYINVKMLVLLGYLKEDDRNEVLMFSVLFAFMNALIVLLIMKALSFIPLKITNKLSYEIIFIMSILLTFAVSTIITFHFLTKIIKMFYKRANELRRNNGDTEISNRSVEDNFHIKSEGKAVFFYDLDNNEIAHGTIINAPATKTEGSKYIIQSFSEQTKSFSFDELTNKIENNKEEGFTFLDLDNKVKAIVIESDR